MTSSHSKPCSCKLNVSRTVFRLIFLLSLATAHAEPSLVQSNFSVGQAPRQVLIDEPATERTTYEASVLNAQGVHDMDPNIYVYTPEFAQRFQMPAQWISADLKGADAVAFRVVPGYKSCGWGGDPKACREDEVRCEIDVYFDHVKNPLPWDNRVPSIKTDAYKTSSWFVGPGAYLRQLSRNLPQRPKDSFSFLTEYSPFTDSKTGKALGWQVKSSGAFGNGYVGYLGGGWTTSLSYDKEIFLGISLVTLGTSCNDPASYIALTSESIAVKATVNSTGATQLTFEEWSQELKKWVPYQGQILNKWVVLPQTWRDRVRQSLRESMERAKAFYKREGEKAMKALRESPVQQKFIAPIQ